MKELVWNVGFSKEKDKAPTEMVEAKVPGAVQLDWARSKEWEDYNYNVNFRDYKWMEEMFWTYRAQVPAAELAEDEVLLLKCGGIDYEYDVRVNGNVLLHQEGMFQDFELDLTPFASADMLLEVLIWPIPKDTTGDKDTRQEARQSVKAAAAYSWDWHPRLVPVGIWKEISLEVKKKVHLVKAEVLYRMAEDLSYANVQMSCETTEEAAPVWMLLDPDGKTVFMGTGKNLDFTLENPRLWWCNEYGNPDLYTWKVYLNDEMKEEEKLEGRVGFRKVELTMNPGTWEEVKTFPKSRSVPPITLTLNKKPIFVKGSNWVNPEIFPGIVTRETYLPLLTKAKEAHMNMMRCWGGAYVDKEDFFDLCDELGIMIWQEFPLACNDYYNSDKYLAVLEKEAQAILKGLRGHASVCLWCGGNELFNDWSEMDDQKHALRLLNKLCYELDRDTPYINTSPLMGMGHGGYLFRDQQGQEVYQIFQNAHNTAYTEFGVPCISDKEYLLKYIPAEMVEPFEPNDSLLAHHAFSAWVPGDETWSCVSTLRDYFGQESSLDELIGWSQWLQCEGYKGIFEEARRQKPYCSMAINWCYNEPWPTAANNTLFNYPAVEKPSYEAVKQALRPAMTSARITKFQHEGEELFAAELWLLNDSAEEIPAGHVDVYLEFEHAEQKIFGWDYPAVPAGENLLGPTIHQVLPNLDSAYMTVRLADGERSSEYKLGYKKKMEKEEIKALNI